MNSLALRRKDLTEARRTGAIADEQRHLLRVEQHLALLVQRLFSGAERQQLDIDMAVTQSLRLTISGLTVPAAEDAAPFETLRASLGDPRLVADAIVMKYLRGIPLRRQCTLHGERWGALSAARLRRQVGVAAALLCVAHQAQLQRVLQSRQLTIDSAPVPCRVKRQGVLAECWYWPLYGDEGEISFLLSPSPSMIYLESLLERHYRGDVRFGHRAAHAAFRERLASRLAVRQAGVIAKKLWHFSGSETGNERVGIFKSLIANCAVQGLKPAGYLAGSMVLVATSESPILPDITPGDWRYLLCGTQ